MTTNAERHYDIWPASMTSMKQQAPAIGQGFDAMYQRLMGDGALSLREKELIAIGMAVRCEPCVYAHAEKAGQAGATRDELIETAGAVVAMQGGDVHVPALLDAMEALGV